MAEDSKALILDLAIAAPDAGVEAAVRVNRFVAEVGVTPPVLYPFGSRDGLVIAAQVARFTGRTVEDIPTIGKAVTECQSSDELRMSLMSTWTRILAERSRICWVRTNAFGSIFARPEL